MGCVAVEIDREEFRRRFPHLAREMEEGTMAIPISAVRWDVEAGERLASSGSERDPWRGYMPDVVAFICRCDTEEQALEIIDYMERKGEITPEYAEKLRKQLREKGLRSFGPKREPGFYFKALEKR